MAEQDTILIVDADVLVRYAIADYLRGCGYRVLEAGSGEEAQLIIEKSGIKIDAVLCQATPPGDTNGFSLSHWIKAKLPGAPVILAGTPAGAATAAAKLCDQGPLLARPYDPAIVVDYIRRLFAKRNRNSYEG
jgi:DNA-binding NtrC family response regulator